jgi:flagellar hook-length control protein FliK
MPDIAVAASSAAVANPAPAANGNSANAAAGGQSAGPFAAVLQRQMEDPAPDKAKVIDAAAIVTLPTDPVPAAEDLAAALLPMLMGSAMLATATPTEGASQPTKKPIADEGDADVASTPVIIAMPTALIVPATTPVVSTATNASTGAANSGLPAATANLAATPDLAAADAKPDLKSSESFQPLLPDNRDVRAAGLVASAVHAAPVAAPATVSHTVQTAVGGHGWDAEVGNHMVWMSNSQASRAELVLTPPQMGKIEISLNMSGDQATATFISANPAVRDAIESAIPRLREILADAGVTLGQTQVGSEAPRQWAGDGENRDNSFRGSATALGGIAVQTSTSGAASWTRAGLGLVDVFA